MNSQWLMFGIVMMVCRMLLVYSFTSFSAKSPVQLANISPYLITTLHHITSSQHNISSSSKSLNQPTLTSSSSVFNTTYLPLCFHQLFNPINHFLQPLHVLNPTYFLLHFHQFFNLAYHFLHLHQVSNPTHLVLHLLLLFNPTIYYLLDI